MKCVEVRGVKIGEGIPKIIVPIVGTTEKEILDAAVSLRGAVMDLTEWRADYFDGVFDFAKVERVLKELRKELGSIPILFTFRTSGEGGEKEITVDAYAQLCIKAAQTGLVDLIDVEAFTGEEVVRKIIEEAHRAGVKVVASNHDFDKTPAKDDIVSRLPLTLQQREDLLLVFRHPVVAGTVRLVRADIDIPCLLPSEGHRLLCRVIVHVLRPRMQETGTQRRMVGSLQ